jgi:diguanylate cyclase (GGDEF)-like protein
MKSGHALSFLLLQEWSPGCVYWICSDKEKADLASVTIENFLVGVEGITLRANLSDGGSALLWRLLVALEAFPSEPTIVEADLEFLLRELPFSLRTKFRQQTLWMFLSSNDDVHQVKKAESLAVIRLATAVLSECLRFVIFDPYSDVSDYDRMGLIADLTTLEEKDLESLNALSEDTGEVDLYSVYFDSGSRPGETAELVLGNIDKAVVTAELVVVGHPDGLRLGERVRIPQGEIIELGRLAPSPLNFPEVAALSNWHARFACQGSVVLVEDLGSVNGTYRNGERIRGPSVLQSSDRLQLGTLYLIFLQGESVEEDYLLAVRDFVAYDATTKALTPKHLEEVFSREFCRALFFDRALTLIVFSLDDFQKIRETYGDFAAESLLQNLADMFRTNLTPERWLARLREDEFAILAPESSLDSAREFAAMLVERAGALLKRSVDFSVSCSVGVVALAKNLASPREFLEVTYCALAEAKRSGRDQVVVAREQP